MPAAPRPTAEDERISNEILGKTVRPTVKGGPKVSKQTKRDE